MWDVTTVGLALIFLGLAVVVVALVSSKASKSETKGAGVLMIGPIPLVFGSDAKWASIAMALAIVLVLLSFLLHVF